MWEGVCHVGNVEEAARRLGQMQLLAYGDFKRGLTYDPATTVGALPHFKFHLLSRSVSPWEVLSRLARPPTKRRTMENRCVRNDT